MEFISVRNGLKKTLNIFSKSLQIIKICFYLCAPVSMGSLEVKRSSLKY